MQCLELLIIADFYFFAIERRSCMKKKALHFLKWCRGAVPSLAMLLAIQSVTSTCFFCLHQPNVPEGLNVTDKTPKI